MDKEKKLTIKYFIEQKVKEVSKFIVASSLIVGGMMGILYLRGKINILNLGVNIIINSFWDYILIGCMKTLVAIFLAFTIIVILSIIYELISEWLKDNWKLAKKRAKKEIKCKVKQAY